MSDLYILGKDGEIIGEVKIHKNPEVEVYFVHALAHAFNVPTKNIVRKFEHDAKKGLYYCSVCRVIPVNAENGIDTCDKCLTNI